MEMSTGEIKRQYKYAKDKKKCVSILAELNCCSVDTIKDILGLNKKSGTKFMKDQHVTLSSEKIHSLYARLDELNEQIESLKDEYDRTAQMIQSAESR